MKIFVVKLIPNIFCACSTTDKFYKKWEKVPNPKFNQNKLKNFSQNNFILYIDRTIKTKNTKNNLNYRKFLSIFIRN